MFRIQDQVVSNSSEYVFHFKEFFQRFTNERATKKWVKTSKKKRLSYGNQLFVMNMIQTLREIIPEESKLYAKEQSVFKNVDKINDICGASLTFDVRYVCIYGGV